MRELIDRHILELFEGLFASITDNLSVFTNDAQALTAIFMFLYFGIKAYGMIVSDDKLEIMPLLRPFALAFVIIFWAEFIAVINFPVQVITDKCKDMFETRIDKVDAIQMQRMALIDQVANQLIERSSEIEEVKDEGKSDSWMETLGIDFSSLFDSMKGYYILIMSKLRFYMVQLIEFIVITLFQVFSYLIFFIQIVFAAILIILGPFSFAFSVLPAFRDAYIHWIARYISVSLYSGIAYIIMSLAMVIVQYGMEREIDLLKYVLNDEAAFILYVSSNDGGSNFFIVSLLVGALTMLTIPVISTWIISTSGVGNAIGSVTRGAGGLASMGK